MPLVPEPLDPASVKLLIEKRNAIFSKAVNEYEIHRPFPLCGCYDTLVRLIEAFTEDAVGLLVASAREHIPLNTSAVCTDTKEPSHIPDPENRPPIDRVVEELYEQKWYLGQIKYRRTFNAKAGSLGRWGENVLYKSLNKI